MPITVAQTLRKAQGATDITGSNIVIVPPESITSTTPASSTSFVKIIPMNKLNIFELVSEMTKQEQKVFIELSNNHSYTEYIMTLSFDDLSKAQKSNKYRAISSLIKKDLIKKIKTHRYMINPTILIPSSPSLEQEANKIWDLH